MVLVNKVLGKSLHNYIINNIGNHLALNFNMENVLSALNFITEISVTTCNIFNHVKDCKVDVILFPSI